MPKSAESSFTNKLTNIMYNVLYDKWWAIRSTFSLK